MKKVIVFVLAFFLLLTAFAEKKTFYVYDADEHDYEGRVVWSSDANYYDKEGKQHSTFIWHMLNLKTGKYSTDESRDSYIIMDDGTIEGFLAAKEEDGYVTVYNVKSGYESEMIFKSSLDDGFVMETGLPMSIRAYMDGYLYYIEYVEVDGEPEWRLKRTNLEGDEYTYAHERAWEVAICKNGTCAYGDVGGDKIFIESPDKGVFVTLDGGQVDGLDWMALGTWLSENKLLFWGSRPDEKGGVLYLYNIKTGKTKKYLDEKGNEITYSGGVYPLYSTMNINDDKELAVYMEEPGGWDSGFFEEPYLLDLKTGEYTELYDNDNAHGPVYFRDVYHEISSMGIMPVWVND